MKSVKKKKTKKQKRGVSGRRSAVSPDSSTLWEKPDSRTLQRSAGAQHQPFKEPQVQEDELGGPKEGRMLSTVHLCPRPSIASLPACGFSAVSRIWWTIMILTILLPHC